MTKPECGQTLFFCPVFPYLAVAAAEIHLTYSHGLILAEKSQGSQ